MLSINTNLSSLIAQNSMRTTTNKLNQAIERMTTGSKINHAKDNAANYSIATNMTTKISAYDIAADNVAMGLDMIATASDTISGIDDKLVRLRSLATQASNGTYGTQSLNAINAEANALVDEIARLYTTAEYNGIKLFGKEEVSPAAYGMRATTVDETKRVSNVSSFTSGETYYVTNSDDLVALQNLVNAGNTGYGAIFELTADIDMDGIDFRGIGIYDLKPFEGSFKGNGHIIKNLTIDTSEDSIGLFGYVNGNIESLGLENCNIKGGWGVGGIAGYSSGSITESYVTGRVEGNNSVGGLVGSSTGEILNCYAAAIVSGIGDVGGLAGYIGEGEVVNCYATGDVSGDYSIGGLIGGSYGGVITNCYATGNVSGNSDVGGLLGLDESGVTGSGNYNNLDACATGVGGGSFTGVEAKTINEITSPANLEAMGFTEANGWTMKNGLPVHNYQSAGSGGGTGGGATGPLIGSNQVLLQVGIGADSASQIGVDLGFSLGAVDDLRMIGRDTTTDFLSFIDEMITTVNAKEVEYGATQNRLESALESITVNIENLTSSLSTIRDADIAEVSSQYIQQQILQQAAATLMSTANQSPAIALQLI